MSALSELQGQTNGNDYRTNQSDYHDHYNYPALNRKDLMSLSTIDHRDIIPHHFKKINTNRDWSVNWYNLDIDKSVPYRSNVYTKKVDFINKVDDIERAQALPEKVWNYPNYILNTRDIDYAYPKKHKYFHTNRIVNPWEPKYKLPKPNEEIPIPEPKFIRDSIQIHDISGTHAKPLFPGKMRDTMGISDIDKSNPKKPYERRMCNDNYNYRDNNVKWKEEQKGRNPLEPDYGVYGGYIQKSHPYAYGKVKNKGMWYMSNDDIKGSSPGSSNRWALFNCDRSSLYSSADIKGAKADTKRYGIVTKRCTNPLMPNYQMWGNSENIDSYGIKWENGIKENKRYEVCKGEQYDYENNNNTNTNNNINKNGVFSNYEIPPFESSNRLRKNHLQSQSCSDIFLPGIKNNSGLTNDKGQAVKHNDKYFPNNKETINNNNNNSNNNNNNNNNNNKSFDWSKLPVFDDQPKFNPDSYKKPNPFHCYIHDPNIKLSKGNINNRRDVRMQKEAILPNDNQNSMKLIRSASAAQLPATLERDSENSRYLNPPCYEIQMDNFLKDNNYCP